MGPCLFFFAPGPGILVGVSGVGETRCDTPLHHCRTTPDMSPLTFSDCNLDQALLLCFDVGRWPSTDPQQCGTPTRASWRLARRGPIAWMVTEGVGVRNAGGLREQIAQPPHDSTTHPRTSKLTSGKSDLPMRMLYSLDWCSNHGGLPSTAMSDIRNLSRLSV